MCPPQQQPLEGPSQIKAFCHPSYSETSTLSQLKLRSLSRTMWSCVCMWQWWCRARHSGRRAVGSVVVEGGLAVSRCLSLTQRISCSPLLAAARARTRGAVSPLPGRLPPCSCAPAEPQLEPAARVVGRQAGTSSSCQCHAALSAQQPPSHPQPIAFPPLLVPPQRQNRGQNTHVTTTTTAATAATGAIAILANTSPITSPLCCASGCAWTNRQHPVFVKQDRGINAAGKLMPKPFSEITVCMFNCVPLMEHTHIHTYCLSRSNGDGWQIFRTLVAE